MNVNNSILFTGCVQEIISGKVLKFAEIADSTQYLTQKLAPTHVITISFSSKIFWKLTSIYSLDERSSPEQSSSSLAHISSPSY